MKMIQKLYIWPPILLFGISHAGVGVVKFADEGELIFNGKRVVKAAGICRSGGLVILEEGIWQIGAKTITVSADKEVDLGLIRTDEEKHIDIPVDQPRSRTLQVEAAPDQHWRLAGENVWRQGSATVMVYGNSHRVEWKEGEQLIGRSVAMRESNPTNLRLPAMIKMQHPRAKDGVGTWITSTNRNSSLQIGDVAVLRDVNGKVVAWQQLGIVSSDTLNDRDGSEIPLISLDEITEMMPPKDLMPKHPGNESTDVLKDWEIVKIEDRDYVTGESLHQFYRFSSYKVDGKHVWLRSNNLIVKGTIGSQELLINNIKFILSYPVQEYSGRALFSRIDLCKLIDPVLRPTHISDAVPFDTVVVDAGHGGHDAGARGVHGYEKDFTLQLARSVRDALQSKGLKVVMTRDDDSFINDAQRVKIANDTPKSIFISLQFSSGSSEITGIETNTLMPQGGSDTSEGEFNVNGYSGNKQDSANIALATAVHAMVISRYRFMDRGHRHPTGMGGLWRKGC